MKHMASMLLMVISLCGMIFTRGAEVTSASGSVPQQVDRLFQKWDKTVSPGCALAVMKDGKIIYKCGYDVPDLGHDVPITPTTVFHVASVSKQFTAAAIVMLAQQRFSALGRELLSPAGRRASDG